MSPLIFDTRIFIVIILTSFMFANQVHATKVVITRVVNSSDVFKVFSNCTMNTCSIKNASLHKNSPDACYCQCQQSSSTFVAQIDYVGSSCIDNVALRTNYAKCNYLLSNKPDSPLVFLDLSQPGSMNTTWTSSSPKPVCPVMNERGQFLEKGAWHNGSVSNTTVFSIDGNVFKWSGEDHQQYAGRIVMVQFTCQSQTHCLMFKVQGDVHYILRDSLSPTSTSPTSTSPISTSPTSTSPTSTSSPSTSNVIPVNPTKISPTRATVAIASSSIMVIPIGTTTSNQMTRCTRGTGVFCDWLYLGLAIGGGVVLVAVLALAISLACRRNRRKVASSNQKTPAFFDTELPTQKCNCDTELMVLVGDKSNTNKTLTCPEHSSEDDSRHDGKRNTYYRPIRLVESEIRPIIPSSLQRVSSITSEDDFTDNDSKQLIQRHSSAQSTPRISNKPKHGLAAKDAVLNMQSDEEDTYEIMDTKAVPRERNRPHPKTGKTGSITGIENQSLEVDFYETVDECKKSRIFDEQTSEEQPNYEAMGSEFFEEQPNYEAMKSGFSEEQPNYEAMETGFSEEQPNYEAMETGFSEGQPTYEAMEGHHDKVYDIPVIADDFAEETDYEIPPISKEFLQHSTNFNRLAPPSNHGDDDVDYTYVYTPESQARELRDKLKERKSWHSGQQSPKKRVKNLSGTRTLADPEFPRQKSQGNAGEHEADDELYSVAEHPKPPPEILRFSPAQQRAYKGGQQRSNSRKSPGIDTTQSKLSASLTGRANPGSPRNRKTGQPVNPQTLTRKPPINDLGSGSQLNHQKTRPDTRANPGLSEKPTKSQQNINASRKGMAERPNQRDIRHSEDNSPSSLQPLYTNIAEMSNDVTDDSNPDPVDFDGEERTGQEEAFYGNMIDRNDDNDEQPLYENLEAVVDQR